MHETPTIWLLCEEQLILRHRCCYCCKAEGLAVLTEDVSWPLLTRCTTAVGLAVETEDDGRPRDHMLTTFM